MYENETWHWRLACGSSGRGGQTVDVPDAVDFGGRRRYSNTRHDHSNFVNVDASCALSGVWRRFQPPIVLIHGYTASVYVWKTAAPLLAEAGFRVIAIDLLGFGYSEKPAWFDYSIQAQARMVSRFMDRLGIGRATVVGSSYGGAVALTLTLDYSERVEKLVLVDAVCNDEPKNHPILRLASLPGVGEVITPFLCDSRSFMKMRMHSTRQDQSPHDHPHRSNP